MHLKFNEKQIVFIFCSLIAMVIFSMLLMVQYLDWIRALGIPIGLSIAYGIYNLAYDNGWIVKKG